MTTTPKQPAPPRRAPLPRAPAPRAMPNPHAVSSLMPQGVVYISDPRVAVDYHTFVGDYANVPDQAEREWLVDNGWAYDNTSGPLPAAYHLGNSGEWTGYPPPAPTPPPPEPAPSPEPSPEPPPPEPAPASLLRRRTP